MTNPWIAVDIAYDCAESIPKDILASRKFLDFFNQQSTFTSLSNLRPQATEWYKNDFARLARSGEQHRNRFAWQHGWRTERETFAKLTDALKYDKHVALAEYDLLKGMSKTASWSVEDVIFSLADFHPKIGKHKFA